MRVLTLVLSASVAALVPCACGGAADTELFGSSLAPNGDDASFSDGYGGGDAFDAGLVDRERPVDGGTEAAGDALDAAPDAVEAGRADSGILCGKETGGASVYCSPSKEICCARSQGTNAVLDCTAPGSCPASAAPISCDSTGDCPAGQLCCGSRSDGQYVWVACEPSCTDVRFCDPNANDCPPATSKCKASTLLPGLWTCQQ